MHYFVLDQGVGVLHRVADAFGCKGTSLESLERKLQKRACGCEMRAGLEP